MEHSDDSYNSLRKKIRQDKYRHAQHKKGLVRYELQVERETKTTLEAMAHAVADELPLPQDPRQKLAKARARLLDELTNGVKHEFFALKDEITTLKQEVAALSPDFTEVDKQAPPLQAVSALPDDPSQLKQLLSHYYQQALQATRLAKEAEEKAARYLELYEAVSNSDNLGSS